eukprot:EG_transcript_17426
MAATQGSTLQRPRWAPLPLHAGRHPTSFVAPLPTRHPLPHALAAQTLHPFDVSQHFGLSPLLTVLLILFPVAYTVLRGLRVRGANVVDHLLQSNVREFEWAAVAVGQAPGWPGRASGPMRGTRDSDTSEGPGARDRRRGREGEATRLPPSSGGLNGCSLVFHTSDPNGISLFPRRAMLSVLMAWWCSCARNCVLVYIVAAITIFFIRRQKWAKMDNNASKQVGQLIIWLNIHFGIIGSYLFGFPLGSPICRLTTLRGGAAHRLKSLGLLAGDCWPTTLSPCGVPWLELSPTGGRTGYNKTKLKLGYLLVGLYATCVAPACLVVAQGEGVATAVPGRERERQWRQGSGQGQGQGQGQGR